MKKLLPIMGLSNNEIADQSHTIDKKIVLDRRSMIQQVESSHDYMGYLTHDTKPDNPYRGIGFINIVEHLKECTQCKREVEWKKEMDSQQPILEFIKAFCDQHFQGKDTLEENGELFYLRKNVGVQWVKWPGLADRVYDEKPDEIKDLKTFEYYTNGKTFEVIIQICRLNLEANRKRKEEQKLKTIHSYMDHEDYGDWLGEKD